LLGHLAAVEHQECGAVDHAGKPVGEDPRRVSAPASARSIALLDTALVPRIDCGQRLSEHHDGVSRQQGAGRLQALALAAGKP